MSCDPIYGIIAPVRAPWSPTCSFDACSLELSHVSVFSVYIRCIATKLLRMLHLGVLLLCSLWASVRAAADGPQEPDIVTGRSSGGLRRAAAVSLTGDISEELHKRGAWRNWEGSVECSPRVLATPRSVEEVGYV